ncbi:hypothetical protein SCLCIDRAFT_110898 [Scleroderma citrinum Foug A]|uniref:Glutaredoxin domain-containing protein n=1 Tax=Scleroderma citrinum Foug A TaxID=1036808 RepID=A0A0C3EDB9_9AGAM|nr:hypothetical protein SCLCIDRAFT_110898 [Scleroderma citrinum Foug A]
MPSPPIQLFLTTIASQPELRKHQEYILRILQIKKIPYTSYDLACDEEAKRLWKRKAPLGKQRLPGILVGGRYPGDFDAFEEAVEYDELDTFLRLKETWNAVVDEDRPPPAVKPIGVPGAVPVSQMTPEHHKPTIFPKDPNTPVKLVNKRNDFDIGSELQGFGLQGVRTTDDELRMLVEELGLGGDDAADMVRSLGGDVASSKPEKLEVEGSSKAEIDARRDGRRCTQSVEKESVKGVAQDDR